MVNGVLPRMLLLSSWRFYAAHPWQAALAVASVALGAAVVVAVGLANQSALTAFDQAIDALSPAATHRVVARQGTLDDAYLVRLRTEEGLASAWPELSLDGVASSAAATTDLTLHAVMPLLQPLPGRDASDGTLPLDVLTEWIAGEPVIALSKTAAERLSLTVGDTLDWHTRDGPAALRVVLLFDAPGLSQAALADISTVQRLASRPGELDAIALHLSHVEAMALQFNLGEGVAVNAMDSSREQFDGMTRAFRLSVRAMSFLTVMVGAFLVYNTLTFLVLRRRATLGAARLVGATRTQLFGLLMVEALSLGLVGSALGLVLGVLLASAMLGLIGRVFVDIYNGDAPSGLDLDPTQFVIALGTTLIAVILAALGPAREAALTPPAHLLVERESPRGRGPGLRMAAVIAVVALLGGVALLFMRDDIVSAYLGLFLIVVGYGALMPVALHAVFGLPRPTHDRRSIVARLVVDTLRQSLSRTSLAVAALTLALAAAVGIGGMVSAFRLSVDQWLSQTLSSDLYISTATDEGVPSLQKTDFADMAALPGVASVSAGRRVPARVNDRVSSAFVIRPAAHTGRGFPLRSALGTDASARFERGDGVIVSEPLMRHLALSLGDSVTVSWSDVRIDAVLLGVFRDYSSSQGVLAMSESLARRAGDVAGFPSAGIAYSAAADRAATRAAVRRFADGLPGDYRVTDSDTVRRESLAVFDRTFAVTDVIKVLVTGVAVLGVFGALMAVLLERRADFTVMRAVGLTPGQLRALLLGLALALGLLAALFAVPLGMVLAWLLTDIINTRAFGWSIDPHISVSAFASTLILGPIAALLAALWPAARADRLALNDVTRV